MLAELVFECVVGLAEAVFECVLSFADILLEALLEFSSLSGASEEKRAAIPRRSWWLPERTPTESDDHRGSTERE